MRQRVEASADRLRRLPSAGAGRTGDPDPATGEAWNRLHVLGHIAEMLPFWAARLDAVQRGVDRIGRGDDGYAARRAGIDSGAQAIEADLRGRIEGAIPSVLDLLSRFEDEDLDRELEYDTAGRTQKVTVGAALELLLVGHLEEHVQQLAEL